MLRPAQSSLSMQAMPGHAQADLRMLGMLRQTLTVVVIVVVVVYLFQIWIYRIKIYKIQIQIIQTV